jgi:hypothetical protein
MQNFQITATSLNTFKDMYLDVIHIGSIVHIIYFELNKYANSLIHQNKISDEMLNSSVKLIHKTVEQFYEENKSVYIQLKEVYGDRFLFENTSNSIEFEITSSDILLWSDNLNNLGVYGSELVRIIEIKKEIERMRNGRELKKKEELLSQKNAELEKLKLETDKLISEIERLNVL